MGLWILEDSHLDHVPGTAPLVDLVLEEDEPTLQPNSVSGLKHGKGRNRDIILVPQPSDSPRDPLNLPFWRRDIIFLVFSINSAIVSASTFMLAPAYGALATQFDIVKLYGLSLLMVELWYGKWSIRMVLFHRWFP